MEVFITLLLKLLPLYLLIILGFISGKYLQVKKESVAQLLLYVLSPAVLFIGIITTLLTPATLAIPLLFAAVCCIVSFVIYFIASFLWKDTTKNILAFSAGSANTGYFGIPVAIALFGNYVVGIASIIMLGTALFANTIGFFIAAKGHHTARESLFKLLKFPLLYAFIAGIIVNFNSIQLPNFIYVLGEYFFGAFMILGMMLIGIAIAEVNKSHLDFRYLGLSLIAKYILWPLVIVAFIFLDRTYFHIYDTQMHNIFFIMAFVPVAINIVPVATVLKIHPEKAAIDVLVSTLFALFIIPLAAIYIIG